MLDKIISGGQTGADQAAWRATVAFGITTGGSMPKGYLTEDGPRPEFAELYGAAEIDTEDYKARTEANVRGSDATLWFGSIDSAGAKATLRACEGMGRPHLLVIPRQGVKPSDVAAWVRRGGFKVLNVAGSRASEAPGIGEKVERFMGAVFGQLGHVPGRSVNPFA